MVISMQKREELGVLRNQTCCVTARETLTFVVWCHLLYCGMFTTMFQSRNPPAAASQLDETNNHHNTARYYLDRSIDTSVCTWPTTSLLLAYVADVRGTTTTRIL